MRRHSLSDDRGFALPVVLFVVMLLVGVTTVLAAVAVNENSLTGASRDFESALQAAEAGAEQVVARTNADNAYASTPWSAPVDDRAWAIATAQSAQPETRLQRPNGWAYGIRPYTTTLVGQQALDVIYGIGYVDGPFGDEYRVVKIRVQAGVYRPQHAILTEGKLQISQADLGGESGSVHSNQQQTLVGTPTIAGGSTASNLAVGSASQLANNPGSWKDAGGVPHDATYSPAEPVPQISAISFYETRLDSAYSGTWFTANPRPALGAYDGQWFDMCIELGQTNATVRVPADPGGAACTGAVYRTLPRVSCGESNSKPQGFFRGWHAHDDHWHLCDPLQSGIFYTSGAGPIKMEGNYSTAEPVPVTIISDNGITMKGSRNFVPLLPGYLFQAEGDITIEGTHTLSGLIASREAIKVKGDSTLNGAFISNNKSGGTTTVSDWDITYEGDVIVPFGGIVNVNGFNEI